MGKKRVRAFCDIKAKRGLSLKEKRAKPGHGVETDTGRAFRKRDALE